MGEAKRRGTFEERKAKAINREIEVKRVRAEIGKKASESEAYGFDGGFGCWFTGE